MTKSPEFANFILDKEKLCSYYPEVLEFTLEAIVLKMTPLRLSSKTSIRLRQQFMIKVGLPDGMNSLQHLRLAITDEQATKAIDKLDDQLKQSKLPTNIKDALDDSTYNPSTPFHQDKKSLGKLFCKLPSEMIGIASKVLRNSDYIFPENKVKLLDAITDAWLNTIRVVYLMAQLSNGWQSWI